MPGGHASHKSTSTKPNTNTNHVIDGAADPNFDPGVLPEVRGGADDLRAEEAPKNEAATQRPEKPKS